MNTGKALFSKAAAIRGFALMLAAVMIVFTLTACSSSEDEEASEGLQRELGVSSDYFDNPDYENEDDGVELTTIAHDESEFIGSWEAPSERAAYMYGNVNLRIYEDGTWKGNITEESFHGKWAYDGTRIIIKSSDRIIHWQLFYVADGNLMFDDMDDPGDPLVLKPASGAK